MMTNSECHLEFSVAAYKRHLLTFSVWCELSQPLGKTKFSSTTKNRTELCLMGKKVNSRYLKHRYFHVPSCIEEYSLTFSCLYLHFNFFYIKPQNLLHIYMVIRQGSPLQKIITTRCSSIANQYKVSYRCS